MIFSLGIQYISIRAIVALLFSFLSMFCMVPLFIKLISRLSLGQVVREDGPSTHLSKSNTPTMGGALIAVVYIFSMVLFADCTVIEIQGLLLCTVLFAAIGAWDDLLNIYKKDAYALTARKKFGLQVLAALILVIFTLCNGIDIQQQIIPHLSGDGLVFPLWFTIFAAVFLIIGSSNAVNITDGLDGLVSVPLIYVFLGLGTLAYVTSHYIFAQHLNMPFALDNKELVVSSAALIGALLGFLWYNQHPAEIFMGDVGALMLGAVMAFTAIVQQQVFLWAIMSGLFIIEVASVMIQVASFKLTGKRVFKMAPLHHHFELMGWSEPKVIVRFWMLGGIFLILSLLVLKGV